MLYPVIGLPGDALSRCASLTLALLQSAFDDIATVRADTLEEIGRELLLHDTTRAMVVFHQPGGRVSRALSETNQRFLVVLEDPRTALADLVLRRGHGLIAATRIVASSCAAVTELVDMPGALVVRAGSAADDHDQLAAAIARHFRLGLDPPAVADAAGRTEPAEPALSAAAVAAWWDGLTESEQAVAAGVIDPYRAVAGGLGGPDHGRPGRLLWKPELFCCGDRPGEPVAGALDITGRARCLLSGPEILPPRGNWLLTASFEISPEAVEHNFVVEVWAGAMLSSTTIRASEAGVATLALALSFDQLPDRPLQLRVANERPAFSGQLRLGEVVLIERRDMPEPSAADAR